jgi:hypothetical protein
MKFVATAPDVKAGGVRKSQIQARLGHQLPTLPKDFLPVDISP